MNILQIFDADKYKANEIAALEERFLRGYDRLYLEVGGKLIDDGHSMRVLPGYRGDLKLEIVNEVLPNAEIVCGVSALDIEKGRRRGDFNISYDLETLRLVNDLKERKQKIDKVVITRYPQKTDSQVLLDFETSLKSKGLKVFRIYENRCYLPQMALLEDFELNDYIEFDSKEIIITGPGANSGKFGICLNQLYNDMKAGLKPRYAKIESYPVYNLPLEHPINLAYVAAAADIGDELIIDHKDSRGEGYSISYDRDMNNFNLLHFIASCFDKESVYLKEYSSATAMGINYISDGIVNDALVQRECVAEIARRFMRYQQEYKSGKENEKTVEIVRALLFKILEND